MKRGRYYDEEIYFINDGTSEFFTVIMFGKTPPCPAYKALHVNSPYYLFEYITKGGGFIERGDETVYVKAGDFCYMNRFDKIQIQTDMENPFEKYFISLYGTLADHLFKAFFGDSRFGIIHMENRSLQLEQILSELRLLLDGTELAVDQSLYADKMISASELIYKLFTCTAGVSHFFPRFNQSSLPDTARRIIDESVLDRTTISDIAQRLHISVPHLIRVFREKYHITPKQYMLEKKLAYANFLLENTKMSVSEISEKLNFSSVTYFSAIFKRYYDTTPTVIRKGLKKRVVSDNSDKTV